MSAAVATPINGKKVGPASRFTREPHEFADVLHRKVTGFAEYWAHAYLQRMSIGIGQESTAPLSYKAIAGAGGFSMATIVEAIKHALKIKTVGREKVPGKREYRYWTIPENWRNAPDYVPEDSADTDDEPDCESENVYGPPVTSPPEKKMPATENVYGPPVTSGRPMRLSPGRCEQVSITQTVQTLEVYSSCADAELAAVVSLENGTLKVGIGLAEESPGEVVPFPARGKPNEKAAHPNGKPPISSKPARSAPPANHFASESGAAAVRDFLLARFTKLHATLDRQTVTRIWGAIERSGAHLDQYRELVRAREKRGKMSGAAYVALAEQDLAAYVLQQIEVDAKGLNDESAISDDWADIIQDLNREEATLGSPGRRKR